MIGTVLRLKDRSGNILHEFKDAGSLPIVEIETHDGHVFQINYWKYNAHLEIRDNTDALVVEPRSSNVIRIHPMPKEIE